MIRPNNPARRATYVALVFLVVASAAAAAVVAGVCSEELFAWICS